MKKVLACIIAVLLLVSMMPVVHAADATVYVSVSVDGKLEVAAQPLAVSDLSVDNILREAHKKFYPGGADGYASGIDSMWNMFMINTAWGIKATPYVILNEATLAAGADVSYAKSGDNIILVTSSDPSVVPQVVSMAAKSVGGNTTISALSWVLDFSTFTYKSSPLAGAKVVDGNGNTLGTTDATGSLNFAACPVAAIDGLAAIPADGSCNATALNAGAPEPKAAETPAAEPEAPAAEPEAPAAEPEAPAAEPEAPAAEPETPAAAPAGDVVYVSVSVDGKLEIAAQPVPVAATVNDVLKAAHEQYYAGGADGYAAGIDTTYNMFMISKFWGVAQTPCVIVNGEPLGADMSKPATADTCPVAAGDNIVVSIASDPMSAPNPYVSIAAADGVVSANLWTLNFMTFTYSSAPLAGATVVDGNGNTLGTTDANGNIAVSGVDVVAIDGLAAIPLNVATNSTKINEAAAPAPEQTTTPAPSVPAGSGSDVYVTVSVDGKLDIVAQPIGINGSATVNDVLKMAHEQYYSGGADGYAAGIDATWNMFMISKAWGVAATPYVIVNGMPIGADPANPAAADTLTVVPGDNIVLSTSSDPMAVARAVSMAAAVDGGNVTVSALEWTLNFTSFTYGSTPLANANVVDAAGNVLGTTDAAGNLTIPVTEVAAIEGLSAIPADGRSNSTATNPPLQDPSDYVGIPEGEGVTVHITVSVNGKLEVAGQKITVSKDAPTIENVLKETHKKWYATGEGGFAAGIDPTWNMYMISKVWGVNTTPYVLYNGTPLGADVSVPSSADTGKVVDGDQITVVVVSMGQNIPVISMVKDDNNLLVKEWTLDTTTFMYDSKSYSNADIIDAATGEVLGKTDGTGKMAMPTCESGVIAVPGLSAYAVTSDVQEFTPAETVFVPPALDYSLFGGEDGKDLLVILIYGLIMAVPMAIVIFIGGRKEEKNKGVKHFKKTW